MINIKAIIKLLMNLIILVLGVIFIPFIVMLLSMISVTLLAIPLINNTSDVFDLPLMWLTGVACFIAMFGLAQVIVLPLKNLLSVIKIFKKRKTITKHLKKAQALVEHD